MSSICRSVLSTFGLDKVPIIGSVKCQCTDEGLGNNRVFNEKYNLKNFIYSPVPSINFDIYLSRRGVD